MPRVTVDRSIRERRLESLHRATREVMEADSRERVAEIGVEAASSILGLDVNGVYLYDADEDALVPVAVTERARDLIGEIPPLEPGESIAWRVFDSGEATVVEDVHDDADVRNPDTAVRAELFLPLGDHGVLLAAADEPNEFDESEVSLGKILAANLETALDQLDQRRELARQNDRLDEFASVVSHDLQTPIAVAQGYLELAREDDEPAHLDRVEHSLERMDQLVDDLLYRARQGQTIDATTRVDLAQTAQNAWRVVVGEGVDATLDVVGDPGEVDADPDRLRQLFENAFGNALEHAGTDVTVTVEATADGVAIADDGPGIPPDDRDQVFERGYTTSDSGTGFGLPIIAEIVDAHGWNITAMESDAGGVRLEITGVETGYDG